MEMVVCVGLNLGVCCFLRLLTSGKITEVEVYRRAILFKVLVKGLF